MRVVYCPIGKAYENYLLRGLQAEGHEISALGSSGSLEQALGADGGGRPADVVVVHIEDAPVLGRCIELMRLEAGGAEHFPRLVVLSTLLTWAGARGGQLQAGEGAFARRSPAVGCAALHAAENALFALHRRGLDVGVVGVGLVYGGGGLDFERVFRAVFEDDGSFLVPSLRGGDNVVPMVHCADLVGAVSRAVQARRPRREPAGGPEEPFPEGPADSGAGAGADSGAAFFSAATDGSALTLRQVLRRVGAGRLSFCGTEAALEAALRDPRSLLWNMDLSFPADPRALQFPEGLSTRFKEIWAEFLAEQNLLPVSFVLAGPPGAGKTAVARALATSLDLQYVDAVSTVRYIMSDAVRDDLSHAPNAEKLRRMGSSTLNLSEIKDPHVALKTELAHILDAKAQELAAGGKGGAKKKEEAPPGEADYSGEALTEELCAALPGLLVRECVLLRINTDPKCIKKGYVLDLWKQLFSNLVEYLEMTLGHGASDGGGREPSTGAEGGPEAPDGDAEPPPSPAAAQESYLAGGTALVVELQIDSAALLQRFAAASGIDPANPKLSKDQQAALKKAEGVIEEYLAGCEPCGAASGAFDPVTSQRREAALSRSVPVAESRSAPGVLEMEAAGAVVLRCAVDASAVAEDIAASIRKQYEEIFPPLPKPNALGDGNVAQCSAVGVSDSGEPVLLEQPRPTVGPGGETGLSVLNAQLSELDEHATSQMKIRNDDLQHYLLSTVMPHLSEMLVAIERDRPDDPMKFAYEFLASRALEAEERARAEARELFTQSVAEARALEDRAAAVLDGAVKAAEILSI